ncbi:enoyl-CoA hydratase/isomerase family protein [Streptomyces litchfieldiae]|uniref:Enoyl-CoA hydratase/isomerase family protein n=1 Tax=Streptomyces litchfieldiae TaxID=3075543 RepID=A0ABU2MRW2_9ACTN|nr:enoyl-CoA hydratase/isomerase family protein [Streptomyces sp. DSM 44938]MDT0344351.1 enoyl-CoA hydratase/isomerase family protein [Streptomyces sp. DSM 44938]
MALYREFKTLAVGQDGHVLHVRFNVPESGNAITQDVLNELLTVLGAARDDTDIRVLVLSGAGEDFCLGGDLREYDALLAEDPAGAGIATLGAKARQVCDALATADLVTVARLHGRVVGAGLALALFCDLRVGSDTSRFRMPELAVGIPMAWGGAVARLLQEAGAARIRELLLLGTSFDAVTARDLAVLHRIAPEHELDQVIREWTGPLVRRSPVALRVTKALLNSYAAASRLADASIVEGELLAAALAARNRTRHEI